MTLGNKFKEITYNYNIRLFHILGVITLLTILSGLNTDRIYLVEYYLIIFVTLFTTNVAFWIETNRGDSGFQNTLKENLFLIIIVSFSLHVYFLGLGTEIVNFIIYRPQYARAYFLSSMIRIPAIQIVTGLIIYVSLWHGFSDQSFNFSVLDKIKINFLIIIICEFVIIVSMLSATRGSSIAISKQISLLIQNNMIFPFIIGFLFQSAIQFNGVIREYWYRLV